VEMHGGTVAAHSDGEGKGATFTVRLPIKAVRIDESGDGQPQADRRDSDDAETSAAQGSPLLRLDGLRLLVVDDEADARRLLVKVLEGVGAVVTAVGSADEALEAFDRAESGWGDRQRERWAGPDLLISDLGMPDRDGYDLIREVRRRGHTAKDLPAVALTAFVHKNDARQALLAGFQVHVPKPVDPHDLTAVIASLAGRTGGR